jgi:putative ABC transport system substrate-binding protein
MIDLRDCWTLLVAVLALLAVPGMAEAQRESRVARIGFLVMARNPGVESAFPRGLAELGYVEGRDVFIQWWSAEGRGDRLPALAAEVVQWGAEIIVAGGPEARIAAMKATATIPIVVVGGVDPVAEGWAASLARPGGNVTGFTATYPELIGKKLELLKQLIPRLSRVAVIQDDALPPSARAESTLAMRAAASSLRLDVKVIDIRGPDDFNAAFREAIQDRRQALVVVETAMVFAHRAELAERARNAKLPTIGEWAPSASAGFLLTYGADLSDLLRRAAIGVDKILKGAQPAVLPVERPMKFQLVINLKTAKALGLPVPPSLLLHADQIIQ